jgi:hypothetical protein
MCPERICAHFFVMDRAEREAAEMLVPERRRQRFVTEGDMGLLIRALPLASTSPSA